MGDFFVDDQFFDHPKTLMAGEDASNLAVRAFAWAHRHNTGDIPKPALSALTGKTNPDKLATALVEAGLWEDHGGFWRIHDWTVRNAKSIAKREQSRQAAQARWAQHNIRSADADADASVSHSDRSADAIPNQPRTQGPKDPRTKGPKDTAPEAPGFVDFWSAYPRKVGKPAALKNWKKLKPAEHGAVAAGLTRWVTYWQLARTDVEYIPHPSTWLSGRRWEDVPPPVRTVAAVREVDALDAYRQMRGLRGLEEGQAS